MATTTQVNGQTVVHKTSEGTVTIFPDTCLTPVGPTVVPIPYTNLARSEDTANGSKTVLVDGNPIMLKESVFSKSSGGIGVGIASGTCNSVATFQNYSFDVKVEGRNVCRRLDLMTSNNGNTPPGRLMQPNAVGSEQDGGAEAKYPLSIVFVYQHADEVSGKRRQPVFQVPHSIKGPEAHKHTDTGYVGAVHNCEQPKGVYEIAFEEDHSEKESSE